MIYTAASPFLIYKGFSFSKPLVSKNLLCSDWSDGPVCCDWFTLLWLARWPMLWLVYSALIGQVAQSVVIESGLGDTHSDNGIVLLLGWCRWLLRCC